MRQHLISQRIPVPSSDRREYPESSCAGLTRADLHRGAPKIEHGLSMRFRTIGFWLYHPGQPTNASLCFALIETAAPDLHSLEGVKVFTKRHESYQNSSFPITNLRPTA